MMWWLTLVTGGIVLGMLTEVANRTLGKASATICLIAGALCLGALASTLL
jgi:hypothetical protein